MTIIIIKIQRKLPEPHAGKMRMEKNKEARII